MPHPFATFTMTHFRSPRLQAGLALALTLLPPAWALAQNGPATAISPAVPALPAVPATPADPAGSRAPAGPPAAAQPDLEISMVKIIVERRVPDLSRPWMNNPSTQYGTGVIIDGKRILTTANAVRYASQVQVQGFGSGDKMLARVKAIGHGIDLAVLELEDDSFFNTRKPADRMTALPQVRDQATVYGFPSNADTAFVTRANVARIDFSSYRSFASGLRGQLDANAPNGGAVFVGDRLAGLCFGSGDQFIPSEEIERFLADIADGRYDGKPGLFFATQTLENPALRDLLKVGKDVTGTIVMGDGEGLESASGPLRQWDLITHIGEHPVDNQGKVTIGRNLRVNYRYYAADVARDGKVPLRIIRNGKPMTVQVPAPSRPPRLLRYLDGDTPSYFIYGPMVFTAASRDYAEMLGNPAYAVGNARAGSPLIEQFSWEPDREREELVVLSVPYLSPKTVTGYRNRPGTVVYSINGTPVRSLAHMVALLRDLKDDMVVVHFDQRDSESLVLDRKEVLAATDGVLNDNGIRQQGSADMLKVWQAR